MNFIITTSCNKGCPYCFANVVKKDNQYMSLEQFKSLVEKNKLKYIKLLGGEPTTHPNFKEILDYSISKKVSVTLISNFLFEDDILEHIVNHIKSGSDIRFLINSTDLDKNNRLERWSKNYNAIYSVLYEKGQEESLSCGITLELDKDINYYINYLESLAKSTVLIEKLRISLPFPGEDKDKSEESINKIIHNVELGDTLIGIFKYCLSNFIVPTIDCIVYPCIFRDKEYAKIIKKFTYSPDAKKSLFKCSGVPLDIFPDNTACFCYPLKNSISYDLKDFNYDLGIAEKTAIEKYKIVKYDFKKFLPEKCKNCDFLKNDICEGPCLGSRDLSSLDF